MRRYLAVVLASAGVFASVVCASPVAWADAVGPDPVNQDPTAPPAAPTEPSAKIALVYRGPGACDEGCADAAALVATMAGYHAEFVGPSEKDPKIFDNAAVWVQPGGAARNAARAMSSGLKDNIRAFVHGGGAYVGFCAGGFLATDRIGTLSDKGLGLIAGRTKGYTHSPTGASILDLSWGGQRRNVYWEGGPVFYPPPAGGGVEITANYPDGTAASIRAPYGTGRVYVTGMHPEAPQAWRDYYHLKDSDGLDYDLAVDMIRWATQK